MIVQTGTLFVFSKSKKSNLTNNKSIKSLLNLWPIAHIPGVDCEGIQTEKHLICIKRSASKLPMSKIAETGIATVSNSMSKCLGTNGKSLVSYLMSVFVAGLKHNEELAHHITCVLQMLSFWASEGKHKKELGRQEDEKVLIKGKRWGKVLFSFLKFQNLEMKMFYFCLLHLNKSKTKGKESPRNLVFLKRCQ